MARKDGDNNLVNKCVVCGSKKNVFRYTGDRYQYKSQLLCRRHKDQVNKYGEIKDKLPSASANEYIKEDGIYKIILKNNKHVMIGEAIISELDYEKVVKYKWWLGKDGYVGTSKPKGLLLHRLILDMTDSTLVVDHINRNKLDCRKENLRKCTQLENNKNSGMRKDNTTGTRGVYFEGHCKFPYVAKIHINNKTISLGRFDSIEEATRVRRDAELRYFKEFAPSYDKVDSK